MNQANNLASIQLYLTKEQALHLVNMIETGLPCHEAGSNEEWDAVFEFGEGVADAIRGAHEACEPDEMMSCCWLSADYLACVAPKHKPL